MLLVAVTLDQVHEHKKRGHPGKSTLAMIQKSHYWA